MSTNNENLRIWIIDTASRRTYNSAHDTDRSESIKNELYKLFEVTNLSQSRKLNVAITDNWDEIVSINKMWHKSFIVNAYWLRELCAYIKAWDINPDDISMIWICSCYDEEEILYEIERKYVLEWYEAIKHKIKIRVNQYWWEPFEEFIYKFLQLAQTKSIT